MIKKVIILDLFLFFALAGLSYFNSYFPLDLVITKNLQSIHVGWFYSLMRFLTYLGEPSRSLSGVLLASLALYLLKLKKDAILIIISSYSLVLVTALIKFLVHRVRPSPLLIHQFIPQLKSGSFPSYHVIITIAVLGYLYFIVHKHIKRRIVRGVFEFLFLFVIFLMAISRVYLGAHWASDVLGSFLLGFAWLALLAKYGKSGV